MKLGYLVGALEPGGAERQLIQLAAGMIRLGHDVTILAYSGKGMLDDYARSKGVNLICLSGGSKLMKIKNIRNWISQEKPDVLHGIMKRASSLAVLANLGGSNCAVIASDYSTATYAPYKPSLWVSLLLFALSDHVVTETRINKQNLIRLFSPLKNKVVVIRNGVDTTRFQFIKRDYNRMKPFRFLCSGSVYSVKNPFNVAQAVNLVKKQTEHAFELRWIGRFGLTDQPSDAYRQTQNYLVENDLESEMQFIGHVDNVVSEYHNASVLVHVSKQDGIPNAVVEAMATGLPVIVSNVSDLPEIVALAENGKVCRPEDPESIAKAMLFMLNQSAHELETLSKNSMEIARDWFHINRFISEHESLYVNLIDLRRHGE